MRAIRIPKALHDIFGESQTAFNLVLIFAGGVALTLAFVASLVFDSAYPLPPWLRLLPAVLLVFDISCGCVANFSEGTSNYYARRPNHRWIFIAIHWHSPVCALLLGWSLPIILVFWVYTLAAASVVNWRTGRADQPLVAGLLLAIGLSGIVLGSGLFPAPAASAMLVTVLFMIKVLFAFGVDHFRVASNGSAP